MKLRHLVPASLCLAIAHAAEDESNLVLLDTVNPAIRDLAAEAGDDTTYDSLNGKNKIGVFYSDGLTAIDATKTGFWLLAKPNGGSWVYSDFLHPGSSDVFTVNSAGYYQPLPQQPVSWSCTFANYVGGPAGRLAFGNTSSNLSLYNSGLLDSSRKTHVYKRLGFPSELDSEPDKPDAGYEEDRKGISTTAKKFVVVIHGWNPGPNEDPYDDNHWPALMQNLHNVIESKEAYAPDWDLYAYRWGQDSYTGPAIQGIKHSEGGLGEGMENGTQAAEIGYQHGLVLGKLIDEHCARHGISLEQLQFVAHSAGTWVARSASLYLKAKYGKMNPGLRQQITLLDPYNPGTAWVDADNNLLENSTLNTDKLTNGWISRIGAAGHENIYSVDKFILGTNEEYAGLSNFKVGDSWYPKGGGMLTKWDDHAGPVNFFAFTVNPSDERTRTASDANKRSSYSTVAGWEKSLFMQEYRMKKPISVANVGAVLASTSQGVSGRHGPSHAPTDSPWREILVDVDENSWVRAMLMPHHGGAADLAGPVRLEDDGSFAMGLAGGGTLTGGFDGSVSPARVSLAVNGLAFGVATPVAQGGNNRRGVDAVVNNAGHVVYSMVLADGTVALNVEADSMGTGWAASGTGTVDGNGRFSVSGSNDFAAAGTMDDSGAVNMESVTVDPPQVPEIVVVDSSGKVLQSGNAQLGFANTRKGSASGPQAIAIRNTGTVPLMGLAASVTGTGAKDFSISGWSGSPLAPGASMTFKLFFKPTANGLRQGAVRITSNDMDENPFEIRVKGTGVSPEIDVLSGTRSLADGRSTVNFGHVKRGAYVKRTFTIRNRGTATLNLGRVSKNGNHAMDYTVSRVRAMNLAPGASTTFTVSFKPAAAGARIAQIHLVSNDANESPYDIKLSGTGMAPTKESAALVDLVMGRLKPEGPRLAPVVGSILLPDGRRCLTLAVRMSPGGGRPIVEVSPNLVDWFSGPHHTTILQDDESWFRVRDDTPVTLENKRFIRVKPGW